jgi:hypothetical protein
MSGAIPPLPQYAFIAWCSVKKAQGQLYLYLLHIRSTCCNGYVVRLNSGITELSRWIMVILSPLLKWRRAYFPTMRLKERFSGEIPSTTGCSGWPIHGMCPTTWQEYISSATAPPARGGGIWKRGRTLDSFYHLCDSNGESFPNMCQCLPLQMSTADLQLNPW